MAKGSRAKVEANYYQMSLEDLREALNRLQLHMAKDMDDEDGIREIARTTLEGFGYSVLTAADGTEAMALYAQNKMRIAAVVIDMIMPHMDGITTIRALRRIAPALEIIATTGHSEGIRTKEMSDMRVRRLLLKPYSAEDLLNELAEAVQASQKLST